MFRIASLSIALGLLSPAAIASPCGPVSIPNAGVVSEFEQMFLEQDWNNLGSVLPGVSQAGIATLTIQLASKVDVSFTGCETVIVKTLPPRTHQRVNVYYTENGIGLYTYSAVMVLQGEPSIVHFVFGGSFREIMSLIR